MEDLKKIVDKFVSDQKLGNKYVIWLVQSIEIAGWSNNNAHVIANANMIMDWKGCADNTVDLTNGMAMKAFAEMTIEKNPMKERAIEIDYKKGNQTVNIQCKECKDKKMEDIPGSFEDIPWDILDKATREALDEIIKKVAGKCPCPVCVKRRAAEKQEKTFKEREIKYSIQGDRVCATFSDFVDFVTSPAGFGDSIKEARSNLRYEERQRFKK